MLIASPHGHLAQHTDYARFCRAAWDHPLHTAVMNVADFQVPGIAWTKVNIRCDTELNARVASSTRLPGPGRNRRDATGLDDLALPGRPSPQPEPGAEHDDLCGRKGGLPLGYYDGPAVVSLTTNACWPELSS